jgi:hypothetical protein
MAAGSATALLGARRIRQGRPRYTAIGAVLVALAVAFVTSMVGRELVRIRSLATEVQDTVLPQIMARQQRAIWIESLRSAADVVLYAPDRTTRHRALAKAEQLAANVTQIDLASREALDTAWAAIRLAAGKTDEAERIHQEIQAILREADSLISDMSANLSSIVDDSGATIARMVREAMSMREQSPFSREALDEVMAINTTSHDLLASLDRGRIILSSALALESGPELASAETHFVAIGTQLRARVSTLRGNSDYEYLPAMIERFRHLAALFEHQRNKLALLQEAMSASTSAKLRLGVVRESLAADAAEAADASIADIAASARRIKLTAAAMVVILIVAAAVALRRSRQRAAARAGDAAAAPDDELAAVPSAATVRATAAALERLIKAQANLEHWRNTLAAKLTGAVGSALQRVAAPAADPPADLRLAAPDEPAAGPEGGSADARLPAELAPCLARVVALIEDVAAQTGLAGLKAALHGVWLLAGASASPDQAVAADRSRAAADQPFSPAEVLAAAAAAADAVTEAIGATISQVNALAQRADRDLPQAASEAMQMVAQLADQLVAIRNGDGLRRSGVGW